MSVFGPSFISDLVYFRMQADLPMRAFDICE